MAYGSVLTDVVQSSVTGTPPQFNDGAGTQTGTLCRAWVNFDGTAGSPTPRASFNITSITKGSTGTYVLNLTNAMTDANGASVGSAIPGTASSTNSNRYVSTAVIATNQIRVNVCDVSSASTFDDSAYINIAVFR